MKSTLILIATLVMSGCVVSRAKYDHDVRLFLNQERRIKELEDYVYDHEEVIRSHDDRISTIEKFMPLLLEAESREKRSEPYK